MWVVIHEQKKDSPDKTDEMFHKSTGFFFAHPSWKEPIEDLCKGETPSIKKKLEGDWVKVFSITQILLLALE